MKISHSIAALWFAYAAAPAFAADILSLSTPDVDAVLNECDSDLNQLSARARLLAIKLSQANSEIARLKDDLAKAPAAKGN